MLRAVAAVRQRLLKQARACEAVAEPALQRRERRGRY
jgi:hypothetical protein